MEWTDDKVELLKTLIGHECTMNDITKIIGCTSEQLSRKLYSLRKNKVIVSPKRTAWSDEDIELLKKSKEEGLSYCDIAVRLGRTKEGVRDRWKLINGIKTAKCGKRDKPKRFYIKNTEIIRYEVEKFKDVWTEVVRIKLNNGYLFVHDRGLFFGKDPNIPIGL